MTKIERVLELSLKGMTPTQIVEATGMTRNQVAGYITRLRARGALDMPDPNPTRADDERLLRGIRLRRAGHSWVKAAQLAGFRTWKVLQGLAQDVLADDARAEGVPMQRLEREYGL